MLAARQGGILNASQLGQSIGITYHTVNIYLDHLEAAFLIRRLPGLRDLQKRLREGSQDLLARLRLVHALLGLMPEADLWAQPWVGASWEGWVIGQILAARQARGENFQAFYFRTQDGLEADLLLESGKQREIIEINWATSPSQEYLTRLEKVAALSKATRQVLVSRAK